MTVQQQIDTYLAAQPDAKRADLAALDALIRRALPGGRTWFFDGTDDRGKTVSNPSIGYGEHTMHYADGSTRDFYRIGLSANKSGISVYILGLDDRKYLPATYGATIGKATVSGYCIKFKAVTDIDVAVLEAAVRDGAGRG